jgi:hypothetical protein
MVERLLRIGFCGHQPELARFYISTGESAVLCCVPAAGPGRFRSFWSSPLSTVDIGQGVGRTGVSD